MAKKRSKTPKFIKNTPSGKRALAGARRRGGAVPGKDFFVNPDGSGSSILTGTFGVNIDGKEKTIIAPHIVKDNAGNLVRLTSAQAVSRALATGDFAVAKSVAAGTKKSQKFSRRLGSINRKVRAKAARKKRGR